MVDFEQRFDNRKDVSQAVLDSLEATRELSLRKAKVERVAVVKF